MHYIVIFLCRLRHRAMLFSVLLIYACAPASAEMATVAVLRTAPPYAVEIEEGLKRGLTELGYIEGKNIRYLPTRIVTVDVADFPGVEKHVHTILEAGPDVIATIGTQASTPAWSIVEKSALPMVFAGVTYPIKEGLIGAFGKPTDKPITGISYGAPVQKRVEVIRELFPDSKRFKRLAFVYSGKVQQELAYVNNLKALGKVADFEFVYIDFFDLTANAPDVTLLIDRLHQADPDIVFGWYSLDQLGSQQESAHKLFATLHKPILGLTSGFTDQGAIGGVMTDHADQGHQQAQLIDRILKGERAGNIPPVEPTAYRIEINLPVARQLGIEFSPDIQEKADRILE